MISVTPGKGMGREPLRAATAAMGTRFEIVIATDDEVGTRPVVEEAIHEIEELHRKLTRFATDSLLSHINRSACETAVRLDYPTFQLFQYAQQVQAESHGAFDITLGSGAFVLDESTYSIRLCDARTQLDLGGIAKGFALDRAAAILRGAGVTSALLHGGTSSVLAIGAPPGAAAWRVAVADTHKIPFVDLCDHAMSVSRPKSGIYDPLTAERIHNDRIAIAIGPSAAICDAWSTALVVQPRIQFEPPAGFLFHAKEAH